MKLIVGLGNPGVKFEFTRHNTGFMVIDNLVKALTPSGNNHLWTVKQKPKLLFLKLNDFLFLKPHTYMNLAGLAVIDLMTFYKIDTHNLWVIHDDIDLPLGKLRIRRGGGSGGHHGIESIVNTIKSENFIRFRVGVGESRHGKLPERNLHRREVEKFVLSPFTTHQEGTLRKMIKKTVTALNHCLDKGIINGMNRFN